MRSTKRKTLEGFIIDAKEVHGNDYDYSCIDKYVNNRTHVNIRCNTCGLVFSQTPHAHLSGQGCPECGKEKNITKRIGEPNILNRKKIFGIGINDYESPITHNGKVLLSYLRWHNLLERCFGTPWKKNKPTYAKCTVCDEWLYFSNFKVWFDENYIDGYQLDKDILIKGNKHYSPDTCCFVPPRINFLLINRTNDRGKFPIGVSYHNGKYTGSVSIGEGRSIYIGLYDTPEDAFLAYKRIKENHIKEIAQEYYDKGLITKRVYDALMKYEIEITD